MTILTDHAIRLLALAMLLILPMTSGAQQRPPILEKLTKAYGLESFGQRAAVDTGPVDCKSRLHGAYGRMSLR